MLRPHQIVTSSMLTLEPMAHLQVKRDTYRYALYLGGPRACKEDILKADFKVKALFDSF